LINDSNNNVFNKIIGNSLIDNNSDNNIIENYSNIKIKIESKCYLITGTVLDIVSLKPIINYNVTVFGYDNNNILVSRDIYNINNLDGKFIISINKAGNYSLVINTNNYIQKRINNIILNQFTINYKTTIYLNPGDTITGIVVDDLTNEALSNVIVGLKYYKYNWCNFLLKLFKNDKTYIQYCITDNEGCFKLSGIDLTCDCTIICVHNDYLQSEVMIPHDNYNNIIVRLKKGYYVYGSVYNNKGNLVSDIWIIIEGFNIPTTSWPTETDSHGKYKSGHVSPGIYTITAMPPHNKDNKKYNFNNQVKSVEIKDENVELNFGLLDNCVKWKGTLTDNNDDKIPNGIIYLNQYDELTNRLLDYKGISTRSNDVGLFEFNNIQLGNYKIRVTLPTIFNEVDCGNISFYEPGVINRDIKLTGTELSGIIINKLTGKIISDWSGDVFVEKIDKGFSKYSNINIRRKTPIKNGHFSINFIKNGCYSIKAVMSPESGLGHSDELILIVNKTINNIILMLSPKGYLILNLTNYNNDNESNIKIAIYRKEKPDFKNIGGRHKFKNGCLKGEFKLESGDWELLVYSENIGYVHRRYIDYSETKYNNNNIKIKGTIAYTNGKYIENALISFYYKYKMYNDDSDKWIKIISNERGEYECDNLKNGIWQVMVLLDDNHWVTIDQILIDKSNITNYDIEIPNGEIIGHIYDSKLNKPVGDISSEYRAMLVDLDKGYEVSQFIGCDKTGLFKLKGVARGNYIITIRTNRHLEFNTKAFYFNGNNMDLGNIYLEPIGLLDLEVVDQYDKSIMNYSGSCDGVLLYYYSGEFRNTDRVRRYLIPCGLHKLTISAEGYKSITKEIELNYDKICCEKIILKKTN
jgi:hypothetical protein